MGIVILLYGLLEEGKKKKEKEKNSLKHFHSRKATIIGCVMFVYVIRQEFIIVLITSFTIHSGFFN
jgi:hypothetical protein